MSVSDFAISIRKLALRNFRNYGNLKLDIGRRNLVLLGPNGAGKTNVLEAVSLLAPGRGLRGSRFETLAKHGSGDWSIAADITGAGFAITVATSYIKPGPDSQRPSYSRQVTVDGLPERGSGALGRRIRILWVTPSMDRIFSGPPSERRRFLDRLTAALDPVHISRVSNFEKLMRERNILIMQDPWDDAWLGGLEHQMAEQAIAVAAGRISALDALKSFAAETSSPSSFPWVNLDLEGELESALTSSPAVQIEDEYRRILRDSRKMDRAASRTIRGPHRTDLEVYHGPKGTAARLCSTGEQKALLIGIILAQARVVASVHGGAVPILLFDEGLAHLDRHHRQALFRELRELGAQSWFSGTDRQLFDDMDDGTMRLIINDGNAMPVG